MTVGLILCGLFLIYRGSLSLSNLPHIDVTIKDKFISEFSDHKNGTRYSLDFSSVETDKIYGVYLGTKDQADKDALINKIKVGESYTLYVDPTVMTSVNGHTLGVRAIYQGRQKIYEENTLINYIGGGLFLVLGTFGLVVLLYKKTAANSKQVPMARDV